MTFAPGDRIRTTRDLVGYPKGTAGTVAEYEFSDSIYIPVKFNSDAFARTKVPVDALEKAVDTSWVPTIENCDNYMDDRTGKYEFRKVRYDAAIRWMHNNGLKDGMTVYDIGSGMGEFGYCLMHDWDFNVRYIPVDGGIDGTDLRTWVPPRDAHFTVALELVEHLHNWARLVAVLKNASTMGVALSTPNPRTTDVIGMDPTHVTAVWPDALETLGFEVEERTFYGGAFSNGEPDSLFATWRNDV